MKGSRILKKEEQEEKKTKNEQRHSQPLTQSTRFICQRRGTALLQNKPFIPACGKQLFQVDWARGWEYYEALPVRQSGSRPEGLTLETLALLSFYGSNMIPIQNELAFHYKLTNYFAEFGGVTVRNIRDFLFDDIFQSDKSHGIQSWGCGAVEWNGSKLLLLFLWFTKQHNWN